MKGKTASDRLAEAVAADEFMRRRWETDAKEPKRDAYEQPIRKMMEEYFTVEEYAARRGRAIYVYGFDHGIFSNPIVEKWARDLGEIVRSPE